ncbi:MAG: gp53-like domain-containing protein [Pseudomonadota bacterium]
MHAIDTAGSVDGRFSEGNPATGQRATRVGADWLNDVQDNLLRVLEEGGVEPTKGRGADLYDALIGVISGVVGTGGGAVPTTRTVTGAGLASGGGDLASDRTITVTPANAAQLRAGTDNTVAATPAGLADAIGSGATGEIVLPGGFRLKMGVKSGTFGEGSHYTAFATAFPTACAGVVMTPYNPTGNIGDAGDQWVQINSWAAAGFTTVVQRTSGEDGASPGWTWIAWGY